MRGDSRQNIPSDQQDLESHRDEIEEINSEKMTALKNDELEQQLKSMKTQVLDPSKRKSETDNVRMQQRSLRMDIINLQDLTEKLSYQTEVFDSCRKAKKVIKEMENIKTDDLMHEIQDLKQNVELSTCGESGSEQKMEEDKVVEQLTTITNKISDVKKELNQIEPFRKKSQEEKN